MDYEDMEEEYEEDEEYEEGEDEELDEDMEPDEESGQIEYDMYFYGDEQAVQEARDYAQSLRNITGYLNKEHILSFVQAIWGGLIDFDSDTNDAVYAILDKLAVKVAKKYPHVAFNIYGKMSFTYYDEPCDTDFIDFIIEYKDKKLTYQISDNYSDIFDARDYIKEGFDFEGCGPLSDEEIHNIFEDYHDGAEYFVSYGAIYEDSVPPGKAKEYKIDWDKKD